MLGGGDSAMSHGCCDYALWLDSTTLYLLGEETDNLVRGQERCQGCGLFCGGADSAMPVGAVALSCDMATAAA